MGGCGSFAFLNPANNHAKKLRPRLKGLSIRDNKHNLLHSVLDMGAGNSANPT